MSPWSARQTLRTTFVYKGMCIGAYCVSCWNLQVTRICPRRPPRCICMLLAVWACQAASISAHSSRKTSMDSESGSCQSNVVGTWDAGMASPTLAAHGVT